MQVRKRCGHWGKETDPVLFGFALGPLARRQAFIVKVVSSIVLKPDWRRVKGEMRKTVLTDHS